MTSPTKRAALTKHLRQALDDARYPLAPRLDPLTAILAKQAKPQFTQLVAPRP